MAQKWDNYFTRGASMSGVFN